MPESEWPPATAIDKFFLHTDIRHAINYSVTDTTQTRLLHAAASCELKTPLGVSFTKAAKKGSSNHKTV